MQKLLSIFIYLLMLIFIESAAEVTGVPASAPAEISAEPKYVALTFDDGPSPTCTPILLYGLRERGVHATFFLIGSKIDGQEELVRRMQAEGHQIGNPSYDHAMLQKTDTASALQDLARCDAALQQLLGEGTYWVRPPYGLISQAELSAIHAPPSTFSREQVPVSP